MKRAELWLSYAFNSSLGAYVAIASTKHPSLGDKEVDVVGHSFQVSEQGCIEWFDEFRQRHAAIASHPSKLSTGRVP